VLTLTINRKALWKHKVNIFKRHTDASDTSQDVLHLHLSECIGMFPVVLCKQPTIQSVIDATEVQRAPIFVYRTSSLKQLVWLVLVWTWTCRLIHVLH